MLIIYIEVSYPKISKNLLGSVLPVIEDKKNRERVTDLELGLTLVPGRSKQAHKKYTIYLFRDFVKPLLRFWLTPNIF